MSIIVENLSVTLSGRQVLRDICADIPVGQVTGIIGPNGCGKTTLLRSIAGLIPGTQGTVAWQSQNISDMSAKSRARQIALLPQSALVPFGMTVQQLVSKGRSPYRQSFRPMSQEDRTAITAAMENLGVAHLADVAVDRLSGGQRQRVWIAMVLAQDTPVVLLDEPINFLDLPHQIDVLRQVRQLVQKHRKTVLMVLHDLNYADRFCDHLIALKDGKLSAMGTTAKVLTQETISDVFGLRCHILKDEILGNRLVVPQ